MNIEPYMTPRLQILTEKSINLDSGVSAEISDFCWDFQCHHESSSVIMNSPTWTGMYTTWYCDSFLWFHVWLTFQPRIRSYDWIDTYLYRMLWQIWDQIWYHPIHGYRHHIFTPEITQNETVRLKILTNGLNRWTDGLNRRVWLKIRLADHLSEIHHTRTYNITMNRIEKNLENPKSRIRKCNHHGSWTLFGPQRSIFGRFRHTRARSPSQRPCWFVFKAHKWHPESKNPSESTVSWLETTREQSFLSCLRGI